MITGELKSQVDKIWEAFWTGGISNPLSVIEQFTYLLFIRRLDERQLLEENRANTTGKPLRHTIFTPEQKGLRWSTFKNNDPESMFDVFTKPLVNDMTVFDHMKQVGNLRADQMTFIKTIISYLTKNGTIDKSMLYDSPFKDINHGGIDGVFGDEAVKFRVLSIIDRINQNAVVA